MYVFNNLVEIYRVSVTLANNLSFVKC